jgi:hypothetical protein
MVALAEKTYTVLSGYTSRDGRLMVRVRGLDLPVPAVAAFLEGAAVRIVNGKAVAA